MTVSLIVYGLLVFIGIGMLYRNHRVSEERDRILKKVSQLADKDEIDNWEWRYDAFKEITYEEMLFYFWKPVKSFYKDHACLKEKE